MRFARLGLAVAGLVMGAGRAGADAPLSPGYGPLADLVDTTWAAEVAPSKTGEHRAFEPAHALNRNASRIGDLFRRLASADSCLDLLGSQRTLHFDLVLGEPGGLALSDRPEPLVNRQDVAPASPRDREDSVTAVLADRDEAQFLHRGPFPCPEAARRP